MNRPPPSETPIISLQNLGLQEVAKQFPEDIAAAMDTIAKLRAAWSAPADNTQEPCHPVKVVN